VICKLLIANRGEIACRIIRTCREMGIRTVAVYSDADRDALHVRQADEAVRIGAAPAVESYLRIDKIIAAAQRTGADALHPGCGFLAENPALARACFEAGIIFVGPPADVIEKLGSKIEAKRIAHSVGIPVVPGYDGDDQSDARFAEEAQRIGYPVMIKASAGGGGKGMREVYEADDLVAALAAARREAQAAFGDVTLLLEKRILRTRHVEIQIMGDTFGNVFAYGERECSIQRRHQKLIEESPSPIMTDELRQQMSDAAVALGKAVGYVNAGTVEFILDADSNFYFLEVNSRLQVEHPVTEARYKIDLVRLQLLVTAGEIIPLISHRPAKYAIEVRICAEDPTKDFLPTTGRISRITRLRPYLTHRLDTGVAYLSGTEVSTHYDSLLAKLIVSDEGRDHCLSRLRETLSETNFLGVRTNVDFLRRVINHPEFVAGDYDTSFIERHPELLPDPPPPIHVVIAAGIAQLRRAVERGGAVMAEMAAFQPPLIGFRINPYRPQIERFSVGESEYTVELTPLNADTYRVGVGAASHEVRWAAYEDGSVHLIVDDMRHKVTLAHDGDATWWAHSEAGIYALRWIDPLPSGETQSASTGSLRAPMPGNVIAVFVEVGQTVHNGEALMAMEAMKMEHRITAPYAGVVTTIHYEAGQFAPLGAVLLALSPIP
jgi:3-methylcrotonyl-CoA carboxylase alpha subunit